MIQALDVDRAEPWPDGPIGRKTKRYPSGLTDEEWVRIAPLMPRPGRCGRPGRVEFREVINAVRYLVRWGCGWRMLPVHFGPWQTVYGWFRELARRFLFQTSAAVIDSQSVKAIRNKGLRRRQEDHRPQAPHRR
jgi:transposase